MEGTTVMLRNRPLRLLHNLVLILAAVTVADSARAQKLLDKDLPPNHPLNDPYTRGEPELMKAAGILSHGGFEFAETDTATIDEHMGTSDIRWLETEHFKLGLALGPYRVTQKEKKSIRSSLLRLSERMPEVREKAKVLDPWLRTHLFAMRLEDMYQEFLALIQTEQSVFPDGSTLWDRTGTYRGAGPHLGQKGKYEVMILPSEASHLAFLSENFGLQIKRTQRWNVTRRDALSLTIHVQQGGLKADTALHGHLAFNMMHNFLNGLEHYSYDIPIWLLEGLAHWAERRISVDFNTFDGAEGSLPETSRKSDWDAAARKVVSTGKAPRMATLIRIKGFGQMTLEDHYATWSMIDFLHRTRPAGLAAFLLDLKGRKNADGFGDGSDIAGHHRKIFKAHFGMSYSEFDSAWAEWVLHTY